LPFPVGAPIVSQIGGDVFPKVKWGGGTGSTSILPLGFARKGVGLTQFLRQAITKFQRLMPRHVLYWVGIALKTGGVGVQLSLYLG
jgi:hypothetical protein